MTQQNAGAATQGANAETAGFEPFQLTNDQLAELRRARQDSPTGGPGENMLAVALAGGAGWNAQQIQRITGIAPASVNAACRAYQNGGLASLRRLPAPSYTGETANS